MDDKTRNKNKSVPNNRFIKQITMKKIILSLSIIALSFTAKSQCQISFKDSLVNVGASSINPNNYTLTFPVSFSIYIVGETHGFSQTATIYVMNIPFSWTAMAINDTINARVQVWTNQNYPPINQ